MRLNTLTGAILVAMFPTAGAYAAAMDRSGQSMNGFLQPGNYVDFSYSILDADLSGNMRTGTSGPGGPAGDYTDIHDGEAGWNMPTADQGNIGTELSGSKLSDIADTFGFANINFKYQVTDKVAMGIIFDQPFGAKASYKTIDKRHDPVQPNVIQIPTGGQYKEATEYGAFHSEKYGGTQAEVNTNSLSLVFGFQPNENINLYAGPVYQTVEADVLLRGTAYSLLGGYLCNNQPVTKPLPISQPKACTTFNEKGNSSQQYAGYQASISEEGAFGWLAGAAYQIPEIALRASLTYRSKINYKVQAEESMPQVRQDSLGSVGGAISDKDKIPLLSIGSNFYTEGKTSASTPQSVNLDFQTGIMADTLAYINLRWVDWSEFKIRPHKFGQLVSEITKSQGKGTRGFDLVAYEKDQISATFGIARKLNDKLALTIIGGWDSGAGEYVSTLGPSEGFWSAGLGGQYSFNKNTFVQAGARYFWLGDAKSQSASWFGTTRYDADFKDNTAIGYSFKIGYRF